MRSHSIRPHRMLSVAALAVMTLLALAPEASAIPAFARRYNLSCNFCHAPFPKLTTMGAMVAGHGFRMAPGETPPDIVETEDSLLTLPKNLPLAIRVDGFQRVYTGRSETFSDFASPWVVKVLSSAPLGKSFSYYFYFLMSERGAIAGAEDAFLYWNDIAGRPVDLAVGQFQVSDPLFKRELRLPVDDYQVYRVRVGQAPATLAYDRGIMLMAEAHGARFTFELLNGNGLPAAVDERFDDGPEKNLFGHVTKDLTPALRLGALGYYGHQRPAAGVHDRLWMAGVDATFRAGPAELNLQYVHREDDRPTFTPGERSAVMDGGFAEFLAIPEGQRWYGYALYNRVESDRAVLQFGGGIPGNLRLFETVSVGMGYLVQRNLRVFGEALHDTQSENARLTLGFTTAY